MICGRKHLFSLVTSAHIPKYHGVIFHNSADSFLTFTISKTHDNVLFFVIVGVGCYATNQNTVHVINANEV
jgi:hypothetical protein